MPASNNSDVETKSTENNSRIRRRSRTCFTRTQIDQLESVFVSNQYPDSTVRQKLVEKLAMDEQIIQIWFKNRRAKYRRTVSMNEQAQTYLNYTYSSVEDRRNILLTRESSSSAPNSIEQAYKSNSHHSHFINSLPANGIPLHQMINAYPNPINTSVRPIYPNYFVYQSQVSYPYNIYSHNCQQTQRYPFMIPTDLQGSYLAIEDKENIPR